MIWIPRTEIVRQQAANLAPLDRWLMARGWEDLDWSSLSQPEKQALHSPWLMKDMDTAVALLEDALLFNKKIRVLGDYDVDGTSSVALVYGFLKQFHDNVDFYIPHRYEEGYGFSNKAADLAIQEGVELMITLDCGTKDGERIHRCREHGMHVVVCDHHEPGDFPPASAFLNPKRPDCSYPFKGLSGCGVGYKLLSALVEKRPQWAIALKDQEDLVAIAAAADIVPMWEENRTLVARGAQVLRSNLRPGLLALMNKAGVKQKKWTVSDMVFFIAPRINAAGRIMSGTEAVKLLLTQESQEAEELAEKVEKYNLERRGFDQSVTAEALACISEDPDFHLRWSTVVEHPSWLKGVVGIVASRLIESHYQPTVVLTESDGHWAGSGRSIEGVDLYRALEACSPYLIQFGGHTMAAGMTIAKEQLGDFKKAFDAEVKNQLQGNRPERKYKYDTFIMLNEVSLPFIEALQCLQPFGPENEQPIFLLENLYCAFEPRCIGAEGKHLKCALRQEPIGPFVDGIGFGLAEKLPLLLNAKRVNVLAALEINEYNGKRSPQLVIKDIQSVD